jgi:hypothetical protein
MEPTPNARGGAIIDAAEFEAAWLRGQLHVCAHAGGVIVTADYVEAWEVRTREMLAELDGLLETILENPQRPGTWRLQQRADELQRTLETRFACKRSMQALTQYA